MAAKDEKSLAQQLRTEGFLVTSVKLLEEEKKVKVNILDRFFSVPLKERLMFTRNLAVMVASGVNITRAINNLSLQVKSKKFQKVLADVSQNLEGGKALSDCLAMYPGIFSELYVSMVKVGETGGSLEEALNIVAIQLEKEHELISKVKGAMMYPAVIVIAMIGVGVLMLTYILPKITGVFKDMDVQLPATTQFIMKISDVLRNNSTLVALSFVILLVLFRLAVKTEPGKKVVGFVFLNLPITKNITVKVNAARFCRIYSSLLRSGVSVVDSLLITSHTMTNYFFKQEIKKAVEQVQKGIGLSQILSSNAKVFPPLVFQMLEVGEETGKTEAVLLKLAEFYEDEVSQITKNLSSIIEPVLMLLIGGAVGFFAVSMLQPMYSVLENIK